MKAPDGLITFYIPRGLSIILEQKELIMCRNCKHYDQYEDGTGYCFENRINMYPDGYCSKAEKRDE